MVNLLRRVALRRGVTASSRYAVLVQLVEPQRLDAESLVRQFAQYPLCLM
jgi:hypothetical protein